LDFFGFAVLEARAWVDSLRDVGFWSDGDHGTGVNENTGGTKFNGKSTGEYLEGKPQAWVAFGYSTDYVRVE